MSMIRSQVEFGNNAGTSVKLSPGIGTLLPAM